MLVARLAAGTVRLRVPAARPTFTPAQTAADLSVAMQHDFGDGGNQNGFKLNFDLRELNLVCRL